jgi:ATP-dependent RNA circularization protein (DNA/RNA ligase family)
MGGGASFRLGPKTRFEIGYRYLLSSVTRDIFTHYNFHYNAHNFRFVQDQRF